MSRVNMTEKLDSTLLSDILKEQSMTVTELAKKLDISKQFLSLVIRGDKKLSKKLRNKLELLFPKWFKKPDKLTFPDIVDVDFIEVFRKHFNYTKAELSKYLNVSPTYYSLILSHKKPVTDVLVKRLSLLNDSPETVIDSIPFERNSPVKVGYCSSLTDIKSKPSRTLFIDRLLLGDRDYSKCKIIDLKSNSNLLSVKVLIDTSKTIFENNKTYLLKDNDLISIYKIHKEKDRVEYLPVLSNNISYSTGMCNFGEIISIFL